MGENRIAWGFVALSLGSAAAIHLSVPLATDVSYFVAAAARVAEGGVPYRDVLETNPPLAFWFNAPPAHATRLLGVGGQTALVLYVLLLIAGVVAFMARLAPGRGRMIAAAAAVLALGATQAFGQREHFATMLLFPYLFLCQLRLEGGVPPRGLRIAAGVAAGVGLCFKPYFLLLPLAAELYLLLMRRAWREVFRAETLAMALPVALYPLAVWLVTPEYYSDVLPLALKTYPAFDMAWISLTQRIEFRLVVLGLLAGVVLVRDRRLGVWLAAAAAGLAIYFVQSKGSPYHLLPAWSFAAMALLSGASVASRWVAPVALAALAGVAHISAAQYQQGKIGYLAALTEARPGERLLVLSHDIGVSFPFIEREKIGWASRTAAYWMLPAVVTGRVSGAEADKIVADAAAFTAADLARYQPDEVLIDRRAEPPPLNGHGIDYVALFSRDPAFAAQWRAFKLVRSQDELEVWRR